jgi:hypothetical protein
MTSGIRPWAPCSWVGAPWRASSPWSAWALASACRPGDRLSWNLDNTSAGDLELGHHEGLPRQGAHADTEREVHVREPPWVKLPCVGTPQLRVQVHCRDGHVDVNARSHAFASHAAEGDVAERLPRHLCARNRSCPKLFASLQRLNGPPPAGGREYEMRFSASPVVEPPVGGTVPTFEQDNDSFEVGTSLRPSSLASWGRRMSRREDDRLRGRRGNRSSYAKKDLMIHCYYVAPGRTTRWAVTWMTCDLEIYVMVTLSILIRLGIKFQFHTTVIWIVVTLGTNLF